MIHNHTAHYIKPFEDVVNVVDAHPYPLLNQSNYSYNGNTDQIHSPYFANLGDLQQTLDVYVVDREDLPVKKHTIPNVEQYIVSFKKELKKIERALDKNSEQWELRRKKSRLEELLDVFGEL